MTHRKETLSEQIEQLVRAHIEAARREASEAVERAFSRANAAPRARAVRRSSRTAGRRRESAELSVLSERLYEAVCAHPGETMTVLAPELGSSARALHRPMAGLKRSGRVRSVGQRRDARSYPVVTRSARAS